MGYTTASGSCDKYSIHTLTHTCSNVKRITNEWQIHISPKHDKAIIL